LASWSLLGSGARAGGVGAWWLTCGRAAFSPVAVRVAGLTLNKDVPRKAPVDISLHRHALCRLSITRLNISAELPMQKDQLVVELASCLC
jgi:hypothetical protein